MLTAVEAARALHLPRAATGSWCSREGIRRPGSRPWASEPSADRVLSEQGGGVLPPGRAWPRTRRSARELPAGFRVMFAGNIGAAQSFETILAAAERSAGTRRDPVDHPRRRAPAAVGRAGDRAPRPARTRPAARAAPDRRRCRRWFALADALLVTLARRPDLRADHPEQDPVLPGVRPADRRRARRRRARGSFESPARPHLRRRRQPRASPVRS